MSAKIFAIGLSKTATKSLDQALKELGFESKHMPKIPKILAGNFRCLDQYDAVSDIPVVPYYPQLDKAYPGSKFILTVRNIEDWLRSMERMFNRPHKPSKWRMQVRIAVYGIHTFHADRLRYVYERHVREVNEYFKDRPQDLLIMDICAGEGWDKLCSFLNKSVPRTDFPFIRSGVRRKAKRQGVLSRLVSWRFK